MIRVSVLHSDCSDKSIYEYDTDMWISIKLCTDDEAMGQCDTLLYFHPILDRKDHVGLAIAKTIPVRISLLLNVLFVESKKHLKFIACIKRHVGESQLRSNSCHIKAER
jgi:hypothetical protein